MKYKVSDISKLLDVSSNTVRRYEDMGYINPERKEGSRYRYYSEGDINRLINIRMFRKYGFNHSDISEIVDQDIYSQIKYWEKRKDDMEKEIEYAKDLKHRLKDNIILMKKLVDSQNNIKIKECVNMKYVLYQKDKKLLKEEKRLQTVQELMYSVPEIQPIIIFDKNAILDNELVYDFGWAIKKKYIEKYNVNENEFFFDYPKRKCVFTIIKLILDADNDNLNLGQEIFKPINKFISDNKLSIIDNALGIKVATAMENGKEVQFILISIPIN